MYKMQNIKIRKQYLGKYLNNHKKKLIHGWMRKIEKKYLHYC